MKRFIALLLTTVFTFSAIHTAIADDKGLADAIAAAKQYITVPENRSDIEYNISNIENGNTIIALNWSDDKGSTSVSMDKDGCLLEYNDYSYENNEKKGLAAFSGDKTRSIAENFLKTVYGENSASFRLDNSSINRYNHGYSYKLYQNDITVSNGNANINVDPDTGKITSFNGIGKEFFKLKYPQPQGIIDKNKAILAIYDNKEPKPEYQVYTDYKNREIAKKAFLAFNVHFSNKAVNAFTGEITDVDYYFNSNYAKAMDAATEETSASGGSSDRGFTPQELEAIEQSEGLINVERASEIVKGFFPIAKDVNFTSSHITKNSYQGEYFIRITSDNSGAMLNAKTGEVISFHYYENDDYISSKTKKDVKPVSEDIAKATAKELASKIAPAQLKNTSEPKVTTYDYRSSANVSFSRIANGYICSNQQLSFTINNNGQITGYNNSFDNKLVLPQPKNVLTGDKAINSLADTFDFSLAYTVDESYNIKLVYCFNDSGLMDSSSATRLNYKGEPEKADQSNAGIEDVKGHWCEKYVTMLYNNGYKINDTLFRPDQPITKEELEEFYNNYSYKPYYADADNSQSTDKNNNVTITRYELADYIMHYYNLERLEKYPDIFVITAYKDEIEEKYIPAVAMATALGALKGDDKDCFNGNNTVTRAQAAAALYNMLTAE